MKSLSKLALAFIAVALPGFALSQTPPPSACDFGEVVLFATNSIHLAKDTSITGDVVVNAASAGPVLVQGVELAIEKNDVVSGREIGCAPASGF